MRHIGKTGQTIQGINLPKLSFPIHNLFSVTDNNFHSFIYQLLEITKLSRQIFQLNPETPNYAWKVIGELLTEGRTTLGMRYKGYTLINMKRKFTSCNSTALYVSILF